MVKAYRNIRIKKENRMAGEREAEMECAKVIAGA